MKIYKFIIIFILQLFVANVYSQIWCPPQATWHHTWATILPVSGYVKMEYTHDTIIQSINCKILKKNLYGYNHSSSQFFTQDLGNEYTYEFDSTIYIYDEVESDFDTIFKLNANIGDKWNIAKNSQLSFCSSYAFVTVQDTGSRIINGQNLKWIKVLNEFDSPGGFSYTDTIFERIGATSWYFLPYEYCEISIDQEGGGPLRCYFDSTFNTFNLTSNPCENITGINDSNIDSKKLLVYPSPTENILNFSFNSFKKYNGVLSILSVDGKQIIQKEIEVSQNKNEFEINVSNFIAGLYFISISYGDINFYGTFIKN